MSRGVRNCDECGVQMAADSQYCPDCGAEQDEQTDQRSETNRGQRETGTSAGHSQSVGRYCTCGSYPKSPALAGILSFLIVGMGQVYLDRVARGVGLFLAAILVGFTMAAARSLSLLALFAVAVPTLAAIDAYVRARKDNRRYEPQA